MMARPIKTQELPYPLTIVFNKLKLRHRLDEDTKLASVTVVN